MFEVNSDLSKATIKKVAAETGVSNATVSRVLNESGYASEEIKNRVLSTVARLITNRAQSREV